MYVTFHHNFPWTLNCYLTSIRSRSFETNVELSLHILCHRNYRISCAHVQGMWQKWGSGFVITKFRMERHQTNLVLVTIQLARCGNIAASSQPSKLNPTNIDMPESVASLDWTPNFEWYVVKCGFKNGFKKGVCSKEIGRHVQYMFNTCSILCSIVNMFGDPTWPFNEHGNLHFDDK
jgi:hypothetical protein